MMTELVFDRMPVSGNISGRFGELYDGATLPHRGLDISCPQGSRVVNPARGRSRVVAFSNDGSFGLGVCLDHLDTPWYSLYAHLSRVDVVAGVIVDPGQQIGLSGNTGVSTGPHLHWQVCNVATFPRDISASADPLSFLAAPGLRARVTEDGLRLRSGPGLDAAILATMRVGTQLTIGHGGWVAVTDEAGRQGWAFADFLESEG